MAPADRTVAVVYATRGGMGDVGKFVSALAANTPNVTPRVISMADDANEGGGGWVDADVEQRSLVQSVAADLAKLDVRHVNVGAADVDNQLDEWLAGTDAVVACIGSRQSEYARWCARGAEALVQSMERAGVERLVMLSSMGIGDDFMPCRGTRAIWGGMLRTVFRGIWKDLIAMEEVITKSKLDYLLVRPTGLTPSEIPKGSWKIVTAREDNRLATGIAKADVAAYMLKEVSEPSLSRTAVTIGQPAGK